MGMHTEVMARAAVTPAGAQVLRRQRPDIHPFWSTERWDMLLFGSSAYTPATRPLEVFTRLFPAAVHYYEFSFLTSLKNYDNEAELFFDWLATVSPDDTPGFVGYTLYEESRTPTLYYIEDGKVVTS